MHLLHLMNLMNLLHIMHLLHLTHIVMHLLHWDQVFQKDLRRNVQQLFNFSPYSRLSSQQCLA